MEVRKQLTADEFDDILPDLGRMEDINIDAVRRVLVDGARQKAVAAQFEVKLPQLCAMVERAWNRHVKLCSLPFVDQGVNVTLSPDMVYVIKQIARQVHEQETNGREPPPRPTSSTARGRALEMPLADIVPNNSRPPDDPAKHSRFVDEVRKRGVKNPISLRPHPTMPGKWLINDGHRRFGAAQAAGFHSIPYFVDVDFDSYDHVNLNRARDGLSPWVLADFIAGKLAEGDSKRYIAQRLGKGQSFVTEHLALVDAPRCLYLAYTKGVASPRTLYDLRRAHDEFPGQVEEWCTNAAEITRETLQALLGQLRRDVSASSTR